MRDFAFEGTKVERVLRASQRAVSTLGAPATLLFTAAYGVAVYALWIGIDFGKHWDETIHYNAVIQAYRSEVLLPRWYHYPSMIFWLSLSSVADKLLPIFDPAAWPKPDIPFDFHFFILRARVLVMLISSLGAWWIFFALRCSDLARPALAAALGGSIYILSWEFGYHARWLAPDLVAAQFVALFVLFVTKAERVENPRGWLIVAAVSAGLATATKYTAGALIVALWLYTVLRMRDTKNSLLMTVAKQTAVALGVYLVITPATFLDPAYFTHDVLFEMHHYATGHGLYYGVAPWDIHGFWRYLGRLWEYLSLAMLSPQPFIAAALAAAAILGLASSWLRSRPLAATLGFLIVFYSIFFSLQVVFAVRNFLILLPIFAYFAGVGLDALIDCSIKMRVRQLRQAAVLATGVTLAIGLGWNAWQQVAFGQTIADAQRQSLVQQVAEYIARRASVRVALSQSLAADLVARGEPLPANVTETSGADRFIFRASELSPSAHLESWPATRHHTFDWIGPREVNLNYYPIWSGADHAFILTIDAAKRMGVLEALSQGRETTERNSSPLRK
jgi:Dolichyl-phosphate-mannose-protein mannosyltransferase